MTRGIRPEETERTRRSREEGRLTMAGRNGGRAAGARPLRADARRNRDRLVAEARAAFLEQGAQASLEDVARRAGVGIGTLYRHFPHRTALVNAVFEEESAALAALAEDLSAGAEDPFEALTAWLRAVLDRHRAYRGITAELMERGSTPGTDAAFDSSQVPLREAGERLLARAREAGAARADTSVLDLLRLLSAIGLVADGVPEDPELPGRLLRLATDGLRAPG